MCPQAGCNLGLIVFQHYFMSVVTTRQLDCDENGMVFKQLLAKFYEFLLFSFSFSQNQSDRMNNVSKNVRLLQVSVLE